MSRYASKAELVEVIKSGIAVDYNKLGTPKGVEFFNVAGLIRDCNLTGDGYYGWTMDATPEQFYAAILANVRKPRTVAQFLSQIDAGAQWAWLDARLIDGSVKILSGPFAGLVLKK